jgi:hypothetical protein
MKKTSILLILSFTCSLCYGQNKDSTNYFDIKKNNIHVELLGVSPLYSVNYERIVHNKTNLYLSERIGLTLMYFGTDSKYGNYYQFSSPISISALFQTKERTFFEIGCGLTYTYCPYLFDRFLGDSKSAFGPSITIMGRHINLYGYEVRFGFTPSLLLYYDNGGIYPRAILPLIGFSLGHGLKK